jgi:hypothetical protein
MHQQFRVALTTGHLDVQVEQSDYAMSVLLEFASRENPKRSFLFLSKVLGKYIPCLPSAIRKTHHELNKKIRINGNCLVLGIAETATGLGAGVADTLSRNSPYNVYYSQTTRFDCNEKIAFEIFESHSHAPQHLIYDMGENIDISTITEVVLVDDEISTGQTLNQITLGIANYLPNLQRVHWASLVNWMPEKTQAIFSGMSNRITIHFHSLLRGEYRFSRTNSKFIQLPPSTATGLSKLRCRTDIGRMGTTMAKLNCHTFYSPGGQKIVPEELPKTAAYVVVGSGEFNYQPFLFAEAMESVGLNVLVQSTGRSPISQGGSILSKLKFYDSGNKANYYLYNLPENRTPILLYENREQFDHCPLPKLLNAQAAILGNSE